MATKKDNDNYFGREYTAINFFIAAIDCKLTPMDVSEKFLYIISPHDIRAKV